MRYFIAFFIFIIVLFFYLHINHHLTKSSDLEIYTIEQPSKDKLEEICNLRQPLLFNYYNEEILRNCKMETLNNKYSAFDIKIRDILNDDDKKEIYLPLVLKESLNLFQNDMKSRYITENNYDFLEETGSIKNYSYNDSFLRPPLVSKCDYDYMSGSQDSSTPLRYNLSYRNYYYVIEGEIRVKLIPPMSSKYLLENKDYDNFEFRSPINPWNVDEKYRDYDKVKSLDIVVNPGTILYIPPYWWYSIKYTKMSSICAFKYRTYMNTITILPEIIMNLLQEQNIKREIVEKVEINKKDKNLEEKIKEQKEQKIN
tara:strand:- start:110 stop:1048 length:939 start_codon:yes stop_codon:yes gene_type:complete